MSKQVPINTSTDESRTRSGTLIRKPTLCMPNTNTQETAVSATTSLRRPKTVNDCVKCTLALGPATDYIKCYICQLPQHIDCISKGLSPTTVKECRISDKQVFFMCLQCVEKAATVKPSERQQIIDFQLRIDKIVADSEAKLKEAAIRETKMNNKILTLEENHSDATRRYKELQTSHKLLNAELNKVSGDIQATVDAQCSNVVSTATAFAAENDQLRKMIDENTKTYMAEMQRLQEELATHRATALKSDAEVEKLRDEIKLIKSNAAKNSSNQMGNNPKRQRTDSMDMDVDDNVSNNKTKVRPTYAEVVAAQKIKPEFIRNIVITDPDEAAKIEEEITKNDNLKLIGEVNKKKNGQISIRFKTETRAINHGFSEPIFADKIEK